MPTEPKDNGKKPIPVEILNHKTAKSDGKKPEPDPLLVKILNQEPPNTDISPIKIMENFGIQKDARFSLRTLLSLSVFAIGIFMFGINLKFGDFSISDKDSFRFSIFMALVIAGQWVISGYAYKIYKSFIDNFIRHLKNSIARIKNVIDGIKDRTDLTEALKVSHKAFMEDKLSEHESTLKYLDIFYKKLNGKYLFWVAGIAMVSIACSLFRSQDISLLDRISRNNDPIVLSLQLPETLKLELNNSK